MPAKQRPEAAKAHPKAAAKRKTPPKPRASKPKAKAKTAARPKAKSQGHGGARKGAGRPAAYRKSFAEQARKLCEIGRTDADLAGFFEVGLCTIWRWKVAHAEFREALTRGKAAADMIVEDRLFQRATGYSHDAVKIFLPSGSKTPVYARYVNHVAPDTSAAIFWLKNRRPEEWRDKFSHGGDPDAPPVQHQVAMAWMTEAEAQRRGWA